MRFWNDPVVKTLFLIGVVVCFVFLIWVGFSQSQISVQSAAVHDVAPGQIFLYPFLGILGFAASIYIARGVHRSSPPIAYRAIITSYIFILFWIVMAIWTIRHLR